jgi:amino acid efflux transporter
MKPGQQLEKSLTLGPAIGLAITMVVGSGLLVLPGLAYARVGDAAVYTWLISAIAIAPILVIFAALGARFPNAGGVTGFLQSAFGRPAGLATEILVLGAIPGGAAVAITGGQYFSALLDGSKTAMILGTALVLVTGGLLNYLGARISGKVQQYLAYTLVTLLVLAVTSTFTFGQQRGSIAPLQDWPQALPAFGLVFFAFVGWELMAFTSEEFKNPKRDFPLMIAISYVVVVVLYTLIALATQWSFQPDDPTLAQAPMAGMLAQVLGPFSGRIVAAVGFIIVLTNFIGVVWAFSRLAFSSAREGLLPAPLTNLDQGRGVPGRAIITVTIIFSLIVLVNLFGWISQSLLFELAGASFFLSYLLAIAVYLKIAQTLAHKALGAAAFLLALGLFYTFGMKAIYALGLFLLGLALGKLKSQPRGE